MAPTSVHFLPLRPKINKETFFNIFIVKILLLLVPVDPINMVKYIIS